MDQKIVQKISRTIYSRFPELNGSRPTIKPNRSQPKNANSKGTFFLTFQKSVLRPDGVKIPRSVRVLANEKGKIIRVSTSK